MDDLNKNIDESWKDSAQIEKEHLNKEQDFVPPVADFNFFVTTLAIQASIGLGQIPNPATQKSEENLEQAKFIIDTLGMLKEKTSGNLNQEETQLLDNLLYELRTQYVSKNKTPGLK